MLERLGPPGLGQLGPYVATRRSASWRGPVRAPPPAHIGPPPRGCLSQRCFLAAPCRPWPDWRCRDAGGDALSAWRQAALQWSRLRGQPILLQPGVRDHQGAPPGRGLASFASQSSDEEGATPEWCTEEKRSALDAKMRLPRHAKSQPVSARQVRRDRCDHERPAANAEKGAIASNLELGAIANDRPS